MKKLLVHIITSLKIGGAESLMVDFLAHKALDHFDHKVLYFHDGPNRHYLEERGIQCYHIQGLVCMYDPFFLTRLYSHIKKLNPVCIHTWLWSANIAGRIMGYLLTIPVLNSFHLGVDEDGFVRNCIDRLTQSMAQRYIAVSDGVAQTIAAYLPRINKQAIKIIKNGCDTQKIISKSQKIRKERHELGLTADHYIIGSVGRWIERKNYHFLISTCARLYKENSNIRLLLLGKGPLKESLMNHAHSLGASTMVIFIEGQPAFGYLPIMDCFIQPSLKEGISIALLEAMSCSRPCIVTDAQADHEVIIDQFNGIIVPSCNDENLLIKAIASLITNKDKASILGHQAYQTLKKDFDLTTMAQAYNVEYNQLINLKHKNKEKCNI